MADRQVSLRSTVAGTELYAKMAEYDSEGNLISESLAAKANVADLAITDVSGDATKKNIQLANGLNQDVLVAHQDISGKQDNLTFDPGSPYNAASNPVATVGTVAAAVSSLTGCAVTYQAGELHLDFSAGNNA